MHLLFSEVASHLLRRNHLILGGQLGDIVLRQRQRVRLGTLAFGLRVLDGVIELGNG